MKKVVISNFVFLILGMSIASCSSINLIKQKTAITAPKVQLIQYSTVIELNGSGSLSNFRTAKKQTLDELFQVLGPENLKDSQVWFSANLSPQTTQDLSDQLYQYGFKPEQISQAPSAYASSAQITLKLSRSVLAQSDCYDRVGQYQFGCAVNWNRAASLHENRELQKASSPGFSPARLERPSKHSQPFNSNRLVQGGNDERF